MSSLLNVTYYDSYSGIPGLPAAYSAPAGASVMVNGLPTASLTNVLGSASMLWTVMYYDGLARNIKTYKQHYLGGTLNAANYDAISTTYNFTNVPTTVTRQHFNTGSTTTPLITIANSYIYDHLGRKLKTWEQITPIAIGGATKILISQTVYNELSQVWDKQLHSTDSVNFLQTVAYTYNERGWLTGSNAALFNMQLLYNTGTNKQYNGNIAYQTWLEPGVSNSFTYAYDNLNRLTGGYSGDNYIENAINYDLNGNLTTLARYRANTAIDFLNYNYTNAAGVQTNQLQVMADYCSDTSHYGYRPGTYSSYQYDANGNMTVMPTPPDGTALANINTQYNLLNLPQAITGGRNITYTYDATGNKLRKVSVAGQTTTATDYISGIQYKNNGAAIDFIQTEEGKVVQVSPGVYDYYYYLGDNLGNTRVTFDTQSGTATVQQQDDYYPFGMEINRNVNGTKNEYLYNKKELQEELQQYDYGARFYDPVIGRWTTIDPMAEMGRRETPYGYAFDDPMRFTDPDGMWPDWGQVVSTAHDVLVGAVNASFQDATGVDAPSAHTSATAYNVGRVIGHVAAFVGGGGETTGGVTGAIVGVVAAPETGGLSLTVSVAGLGFAGHGLSTMKNAIVNMATGNGNDNDEKSAGSSRAARRESMRDEKIPTSQQPESQSKNASGREYSYKTPKEGGGTETKSVQQQTKDRSHPGQSHWEAGKVKTDEEGNVRYNDYGRPKLQNNKSKVNY